MTSYLRDLAADYNESTNAIRLELNHLEKAGLLQSKIKGNKKMFRANTKHPLFESIHQLLLKHTGIDKIIDDVIKQLNGLQSAWVIGSFATGKDNPVIDIILSGNGIDTAYLLELIQEAEGIINRKIRYIVIKPEETKKYLDIYSEALLLWNHLENTKE